MGKRKVNIACWNKKENVKKMLNVDLKNSLDKNYPNGMDISMW